MAVLVTAGPVVVSQFLFGGLPHRVSSFHGRRCAWIGATGCNAGCTFCTSSLMSLRPEELPRGPRELGLTDEWAYQAREMTPGEVLKHATRNGCEGLYFSFSEPMIVLDWLVEVGTLAKRAGMFVVLNVNGLSTKDEIERVAPFVDSCYVGLKGSLRPQFLRRRMRVDPETAIPTIQAAVATWRDSVPELMVSDIIEPPCWQPDDALARGTMMSCFGWLREVVGPDVPVDLRPMFHPRDYPPARMLPSNPTAADAERFDERYSLALKTARECGLQEGDDYRRIWPLSERARVWQMLGVGLDGRPPQGWVTPPRG